MPTVSLGLPERPHLDVPRRQARDLLDQWLGGNREAFDRIRRRHPRFNEADDETVAAGPFRLSDAQLVVAREYGLAHWTQLKQRITNNTRARALAEAIRADDRPTAIRLVKEDLRLLEIPLVSNNWGPPMSHAANLDRLEIAKAMAALGAKDFQHALSRAVLQGSINCARWLIEHGAKLEAGIVIGACETLNADGVRLVAELNGPFTDKSGNPLAPLAMALQTYSRHPKGKHEILQILAQRGYDLPDTPIMAFHCGDLAGLERHLRRDRELLRRPFALAEIYPRECGCDGRGMHWTPIDGTTLLHLALDFHERDIAAWLLAHGADPNARATIDADGFGGHTPLFNAVVCGPRQHEGSTRLLLDRGASKDARANLRKFVDWLEEPRWHVARKVTAGEWARSFPDKAWVNAAALRVLESDRRQI